MSDGNLAILGFDSKFIGGGGIRGTGDRLIEDTHNGFLGLSLIAGRDFQVCRYRHPGRVPPRSRADDVKRYPGASLLAARKNKS